MGLVKLYLNPAIGKKDTSTAVVYVFDEFDILSLTNGTLLR